jgi:hypothetical protein
MLEIGIIKQILVEDKMTKVICSTAESKNIIARLWEQAGVRCYPKIGDTVLLFTDKSWFDANTILALYSEQIPSLNLLEDDKWVGQQFEKNDLLFRNGKVRFIGGEKNIIKKISDSFSSVLNAIENSIDAFNSLSSVLVALKSPSCTLDQPTKTIIETQLITLNLKITSLTNQKTLLTNLITEIDSTFFE